MRQWLQRRSLVCGAAFVAVLAILSIDVRGQAGKRPLSYDAYDAWWSIQGTTLSRDGEWLAYALDVAGRSTASWSSATCAPGRSIATPRGTNPRSRRTASS